MNVVHLPPRGRYLAHEVGLLAGVPGVKIGQWARRGYIKSSVSQGQPRIYSYQDIAEAMVVHDLLTRGIPHGKIRTAIDSLQEFGDWPLTHAPLSVSAGSVYTEKDGATYDVGNQVWHQVIEPENLEKIASQLRRGGWAVRDLPDLEHIEVDPDRLSGRPTIKGRRVPAAKVAALAQTPRGVEILREDYDLVDAEIEDARKWWAKVTELSVAA